MSDLPTGWIQTTLGEIADTSLGKMLDRGKSQGNHLVPYLRNSNVQWGHIDLDDVLTMDIPPDEQGFFRLQPGDLLVCEGGEIGRCAIWAGGSGYMAYQKALHRVRPRERIPAKFFLYLLEYLSKTGVLSGFATGSTIKHLPQEQLRRLPVSLPPSAEQQRIVAALEDYLSRLAAADQSILTGLRRVLRLRQSIVDHVFNDASCASMERLASLLAEPLRNGHSARASDTGEGIRTLTLTAVTKSEFTDINTKHTIADPFRVRDLWLRPGDILVERANTPELVGISALYTGPSGWAIYPDLLIRVRVNEAAAPGYVQLILSTTRLRSYFRQNAKGLAGSMPKIDQDTLLRAELPIPSVEKQRRTVAGVNAYMDATDRLRRELEISRRRSSQFRRSLLAEAFAGRLVPQDPADEPASVLLERVRAERAAQPRASRKRSAVLPATQKEALL